MKNKIRTKKNGFFWELKKKKKLNRRNALKKRMQNLLNEEIGKHTRFEF